MNTKTPAVPGHSPSHDTQAKGITLAHVLAWLGEGKKTIAISSLIFLVIGVLIAFLTPPTYTARLSLLPPGSQQSGASSAALAALGSLGGLAGGLAPKTTDDLFVALIKSDSVIRGLDHRFELKKRYKADTNEALRKSFAVHVRVMSDKKTGVIEVEVDDVDPAFSADLANEIPLELTKLLSRLAVTEAQQRRMFYEQQLKDGKEHLVKAEQDLRVVQEKSGVIVLDKQAEALIGGAAQLRAVIAEREVQLKVLRTSATEQNPDVQRLQSELTALRSELTRMESNRAPDKDKFSPVDLPVGKIPEAAIDYVRARRELKLQETLLEGIVRQYELAKLDEAKEGSGPQPVDKAIAPDHKSKPARGVIILTSGLLGWFVSGLLVVWRRCLAYDRERYPERAQAWQWVRQAWSLQPLKARLE
ncbi:GumC family protein [Piscinibacter terrae]|uniref:Chain length determinant family protein n=1 Tax=Piscinibacter terrae TaxID=2496871 RepID=A0A3N7HPM6_9BURK|nr:Wzz/FepE/Etk N-terminal domain-containing protein [Albitalea terrae]RQP24120.1 chain length determinant family protein [Albitalea terrae]